MSPETAQAKTESVPMAPMDLNDIILRSPIEYDKDDVRKGLDDPENHSSNALHHHNLREQLALMSRDDKRLQPIFALLAAEETDDDAEALRAIEIALKSIQNFNDVASSDEVEHHVKTVPFDKILQGDLSQADETDEGFSAVERVVDEDHFANWGKTVEFDASYTLIVRKIKGVCDVIKWAKRGGLKVRVAGFRHTWSDIYGGDKDVVIMFLPYISLVDLPYSRPPKGWKTELSGITVLSDDGETALCKIMAGTTNQEFLEWTHEYKAWTYPLSVIMIEVTFGGTNAPICHGSGLTTQTLSDLVTEVQYIDANGDLQTVSDPTELRVAAGCFGLLGVVVSLTLKLVRMQVAELKPTKTALPLTIPPPKGYIIPEEVKEMMKDVTEEQLEKAREDFIARCKNDYYLEWFWFPYQDKCWVNTWKKRPMTSADFNLPSFPGDNWLNGEKAQELQSTLVEAITSWKIWEMLSGRNQAFLLGLGAMLTLPTVTKPSEQIDAYMSDGLHFRRGIQNFRCYDCEWEIPIPLLHGELDYEMIQRAWWDGITAIYSRKDAPVRVALEMRLMGDSNVILAPQRGNTGGTIAIEVLTTLTTHRNTWQSFKQQITDKWTSYKDAQGKPLNARPHWAKEWGNLIVKGKSIEEYFKEDAYEGAFGEFRDGFKRIVERRGGTVKDTLTRFGTATMEQLIF